MANPDWVKCILPLLLLICGDLIDFVPREFQFRIYHIHPALPRYHIMHIHYSSLKVVNHSQNLSLFNPAINIQRDQFQICCSIHHINPVAACTQLRVHLIPMLF